MRDNMRFKDCIKLLQDEQRRLCSELLKAWNRTQTICRVAKGIKVIKEQSRWIPVSERLPEEFHLLLCSTDAEEVFMATYLGKMNDGIDCFDDDDGMMWEGDVIAWMPLPKPYKAESEE